MGDGVGVDLVRDDDPGPVVHLLQGAGLHRGGGHDVAEAERDGIEPGDLAQQLPLAAAEFGAVFVGDAVGPGLAAGDLGGEGEGAADPGEVMFEKEGLGGGQARAVRRLDGAEFRGPVGVDQAGLGIEADDHAAGDAVGGGLHAPGLARGAAGNLVHRPDGHRGVPLPGQITAETAAQLVFPRGHPSSRNRRGFSALVRIGS